jgi:hypothetical protein
MRIHCKKCDGRAFSSISALRKHQWAEHREVFANTGKPAPKEGGGPGSYWAKLSAEERQVEMARRQQVRRAKALVKLEPQPNGRAPMLASELLTQLQSQHRFLTDVLGLISGMITQHEENR